MSTRSFLSYEPLETPADIREGLSVLETLIPLVRRGRVRPRGSARAHALRFEKDTTPTAGDSGPEVRVEGTEATIRYSLPCESFRALGILAGKLRAGKPPVSFSQRRRFSMIAVMLDVSRNAVMKPEELQAFLARFALMGINSFMLYTECNYEVPGEEFWGYNTGSYSTEELKALSSFAEKLGIEMFPCIQALAHLRRALHWDAYSSVKDTETVLLVDEEETYRLLDRLIAAAAEPYGSRKIHIGMDEAWDLGLGSYLRKHGFRQPYELMSRHLKRVIGITKQRGLEPMMWSDMFFRVGSRTNEYYDTAVELPEPVVNAIPPEVDLVYWDYYHCGEAFYRAFIDRHLDIVPAERLVMAPGGQTWNRFWADYTCATATVDPALKVCKEKGLQRIIMTLWGDDGNECDPYSFLPVLQHYAEHAYGDGTDRAALRENLLGSCCMDLEEWYAAGTIDVPDYLETEESSANISKVLLWEDPLHGPLQAQLGGVSLAPHYAALEQRLALSLKKNRGANARLALPLALVRVLRSKWDLPSRLRSAYREGRRAALRAMVRREIPLLRRRVRELRGIHRNHWHASFEPWGWETLDSRYGALDARLESTARRLADYLNGRTASVPELEGPRYKMKELPDGRIPNLRYSQVYTATPTAVN